MSDKRDKDDDRFTEAPSIYIGEELVHHPEEGEKDAFDKKIRSAEKKDTNDFIDSLRWKWKR